MLTSLIPIWDQVIDNGWVICTVEIAPGDFRLRRVVRDFVGAVGPQGPQGIQGATGAAGTNGTNGLKYTYSTNTGLTDPGSGFLKFNNVPISGASALYISETDGDSNALAAYLATWDDGTSTIRGNLILRKDSNPSVLVVVNITGTIS